MIFFFILQKKNIKKMRDVFVFRSTDEERDRLWEEDQKRLRQELEEDDDVEEAGDDDESSEAKEETRTFLRQQEIMQMMREIQAIEEDDEREKDFNTAQPESWSLNDLDGEQMNENPEEGGLEEQIKQMAKKDLEKAHIAQERILASAVPDNIIDERKRRWENEEAKLLKEMDLRESDDRNLMLTIAREQKLMEQQERLQQQELLQKQLQQQELVQETFEEPSKRKRITTERYENFDIPTGENPFKTLTPLEKQKKLEKIREKLQKLERKMGKVKREVHNKTWRTRWRDVQSISRISAEGVPKNCQKEWWKLKVDEKWAGQPQR
jgi:hypothetical protein